MDIVYKAEVKTQGEPTREYIGATATQFKRRLANHKMSLTHAKYRHSTALSAHVWQQREEGKSPAVSWSVMEKAPSYNPARAKCSLCTAEKTAILLAKPDHTLNKRSEIMAKCRHRNKFLLSSVEEKPD